MEKENANYLGVSELSIESFLTAKEDNSQDGSSNSIYCAPRFAALESRQNISQSAGGSLEGACAQFSHHITTTSESALADSETNEVDSFDDDDDVDDDDDNRTRRAEFVVGSGGYDTTDEGASPRIAEPSSLVITARTTRASIEAGNSSEPTSANNGNNSGSNLNASRQLWQRHSLLHRSYALEGNGFNNSNNNDDDDDDHDDSHCDNNSEYYSSTCQAAAADKLAGPSMSGKFNGGNGTEPAAFTWPKDNKAAMSESSDTNQSNEAGPSCWLKEQQATASLAVQQSDNRNYSHHHHQPPPQQQQQPAVLIRIDDTSLRQQQQPPPPLGCDKTITDNTDGDLNRQAGHHLLELLTSGSSTPPAPPSSPVASDATVCISSAQKEQLTRRKSHLSPIDDSKSSSCIGGSLSDNSHRRSSDKMALLERRQMEERLRNWKRSNRIITHIRENPFNLHMECLEQIEHMDKLLDSSSNRNNMAGGDDDFRRERKETAGAAGQQNATGLAGEQQLKNYATHLSHLYQRNQTLMDSNSDFRNLLYNIICCLLIQDEQVLSTPSVSKMIDVIRAHLESASNYYSRAIMQLSANNNNNSTRTGQKVNKKEQQQQQPRRKSSLASVTSCSSSTASSSACGNQQQQAKAPQQAPDWRALHPTDELFHHDPSAMAADQTTAEPAAAAVASRRNQKPADFRRISSVSYNDEQLINDLCYAAADDGGGNTSNSSTAGYCQSRWRQRRQSAQPPDGRERINCPIGGGPESAWRYEELSYERRTPMPSQQLRPSRLTGSQSSLDKQQAEFTMQQQQQHDSGLSTASRGDHDDDDDDDDDDDHEDEDRGRGSGSARAAAARASLRQQHSAPGEQRERVYAGGQQQQRRRRLSIGRKLSYLSSDDCFSQLAAVDSNGDDTPQDAHDRRPHLRKCDSSETSNSNSATMLAADVAGLKSELEWTLNRLINYELKYTWLTSNDTLRRAIRKIGVPNEIRGKVWLLLIDQLIGTRYDASQLLREAAATISQDEESREFVSLSSENCESFQQQQQQRRPEQVDNSFSSLVHQDSETQATLKQIELDVNRTMPGHRLFDEGAEGGIKLRRILVAYSVHVNREIAYCQGFNFIVALLLSVFEGDEEQALRGFTCIVDHIFPSKFYFDHYLTGARADQFLLADFICDQLIKNPTTAERKMVEGVTSSITLNWFISLFHGAVPTLTRLTILDHFMLDGVKALFRFTMAILYLAFQVTPPSSCEVFQTIRNTARDMYDIKLLLSIVEQIKLPKESYFAIRRSFYMLQSSFNSDQFYMQSLSNDASRQCVAANKRQAPDASIKAPGLSLIGGGGGGGSSLISALASDTSHFRQQLSNNSSNSFNSTGGGGGAGATGFGQTGPRVCTSSNRSKVCMQNIGKLGRSHLKIMDANDRSNERCLMSPLRNCLVIGISNCGKNIVVARQSARKSFKIYREQDLTFHVHELSTEIFDGFYLEDSQTALIITHLGEIYKIDTSKCFTDHQSGSAETLMLRGCSSAAGGHSPSAGLSAGNSGGCGGGGIETERIKLRLASMDPLTNLLWIYAEFEVLAGGLESAAPVGSIEAGVAEWRRPRADCEPVQARRRALKSNNPFLQLDSEPGERQHHKEHPFRVEPQQPAQRFTYQRKILIIDVITFDMFSAFAVHQGFGDIVKLRTSLVAFCQLANPMSNQFSSRIIKIGPTGRYEHLLSFSDVVDFMINLSESHKHKHQHQHRKNSPDGSGSLTRNHQRYSSIRRLFNRSSSMYCDDANNRCPGSASRDSAAPTASTLTRYYRSLIKSHSEAGERTMSDPDHDDENVNNDDRRPNEATKPRRGHQGRIVSSAASKSFMDHSSCRSILGSCLNELENAPISDYLPVNMTFIFRNGKIALFEFTESYAIHTRESQLDRYDYSRVIDVTKNGDDFVITILTVLGKLIKVVI